MKNRIVKDFLTLRLQKGAKLLLGFSGGPDSMALLHMLIEAKETLDFSLHLAHVDHGWRKESGKEAEALEKVAKHFDLPFHLHRLEKMEGGDLENRARSERLAFFHRLQKKHAFQALLLAHHRDDQAETVFKRLAEGAGIKGLGGLYPERKNGDLLIWRPLLPFSKKELLTYAQRKRLHYFDDATNRDPAYLRARMREQLFPTVEKLFGKRIEGNFARLGNLCQELSSYFEDKSEKIYAALKTGPFGTYLDLDLGFHPLEIQYFIKEFAPITHDALEVLLKLIRERRSSRMIQAAPYTFQLSRSHLFIYQEAFPNFFQNRNLWEESLEGDWKTFWEGKVKVPEGAWEMKALSDLEPTLRGKMKKWYGSQRVPSFFYEKAPVFVRDHKVIAETLSGKCLSSVY